MQKAHIAHSLPAEPCHDVTGVILAGGRSRRMGRDKATLEVAGEPLFERVLALFRRFFPRVVIAGDRPDLAQADLPSLPDRYPGSALGGLYTALLAAETPYVFVAACDMPAPAPDILRAILARRDGCDVVVIQTAAGYEPLFAIYGKACLEPMRELLEAGNYRVYDFYPQVRVCSLTPAQLPAGWEQALVNVNTPEELQRYEEEKR